MTDVERREIALSLAVQYLDGAADVTPDLVLEVAETFLQWLGDR